MHAMPFKEATFWYGTILFTTGIYFWIQGGTSMTVAIILTVIGLAMSIYAVVAEHYALPTLRLWVALLLLTWALLGYDIYDHRATLTLRVAPILAFVIGILGVALIYLFVRRAKPKELPIKEHTQHADDEAAKASTSPSSAESRTNISLEIRPSSGEAVQSFVETAHGETHFRMDIYKPPPEKAHNVQVTLVKIDPLPISEYFRARADFPYHVRLAHLADGPVDSATGHDINPGTSIQFELLYFWKSSDDSIMINGIDTKQTLSRNAWFSIEDKECWHLKYEVSSAQNGIQRPMFFVRREGESLFMSRLV